MVAQAIEIQQCKLNPVYADRRKEERTQLTALFPQPIFIEEIANGYSNDPYYQQFPWYVITTSKGRIKIGWRKRVIEIDWSDSIIKTDADSLFPVTKGGRSIHAWDIKKAQEYVNAILLAA